MQMRRALCVFLLLCLFWPTSALAYRLPRIGLFVYNAEDAFMQTVCARVLEVAQGRAHVTLMDGANSQILQNDQVYQMLREGVDALIINPVDRTTAVYLTRAAMRYQVPVVFINREPLYEDLVLYDRAYYVGNDPRESGTMSGQLIADYFKAHPEADKNGDGIIQYVMLKGEPGHQDAELRTIYSVKALEAAGFEVQNLVEEPAMWVRALAQERMSHIIASYGNRIECVLSNNDEMALGAIDALKAAGYFTEGRFMPVVGVDATAQALEALKEGTLLGTVLNDAINQGNAILLLAVAAITGDFSDYPYEIVDNHYVWVPYRIVTADTIH
ncbi:MAG: galactose ABC transporter substrate-binding protein [Clostridia bacterium]|nr:galactose ABC transporter substrate-binding protein [Clostridia bacterium]